MAGFGGGPGPTGSQVRRLANVDLDGLAITLNQPFYFVWAPRRVSISRIGGASSLLESLWICPLGNFPETGPEKSAGGFVIGP